MIGLQDDGVGRVRRELSRLTVEPAEGQDTEWASEPGRGEARRQGRERWKLANATKQPYVIQVVGGQP